MPQAQDDELEDPLLEDFKALRRKLFAWQRAWRAAAVPGPVLPAGAALPAVRQLCLVWVLGGSTNLRSPLTWVLP